MKRRRWSSFFSPRYFRVLKWWSVATVLWLVMGQLSGLTPVQLVPQTDVTITSDDQSLPYFTPLQRPEFTIQKKWTWRRPSQLVAKLINSHGELVGEFQVQAAAGQPAQARLTLPPDLAVPAGQYKVAVDVSGQVITQDFSWGVLAVNTDQPVYQPGEIIDISLAVLNAQGEMVCDAEVEIDITNTHNAVAERLSTANGQVQSSYACQQKSYTTDPDYAARYQAGEPGIYNMQIRVRSAAGEYVLQRQYEVTRTVPFTIKRITATRLYPVAEYPVRILVTAQADFRGQVTEQLPRNFTIVNHDANAAVQHNQLQWTVDWQAGQTYELQYRYDAPDKSPDYYHLGPLTFWQDEQTIYTEPRAWQLAIDPASTTTTTVVTSIDEGNGAEDVSWRKRVFHDPNNDRWHIVFIDGDSEIHTYSTADTSGTSWTDGALLDIGNYDYDDFSCAIHTSGGNTYLHCVYAVGTNQNLFYRRCQLTGTTPFISCDTEQTVYAAVDTADDVSSPNIVIDSNQCALVAANVRDNSVANAADRFMIYLWKEDNSTCGDGTWSNETGFPLTDIQTEAGYASATAVGIESFGDADAQIYWLDTDSASANQMESVYFNGGTNAIGTQVTLHSDIEGHVQFENYWSVITGTKSITFGMQDGSNDLLALITSGKDSTSVSSVDTIINTPYTTGTGSITNGVTAIIDTIASGADDIWLFAVDNADTSDIVYNKSTDGGTTWGGSTTQWVNSFDTTEVKYLSAYFNSENCDVMVTWLGNAATPWNINTKVINTGSCTNTVSSTGTQTASLTAGTTAQHVGGAFVIVENTSSRNVTGITIEENGTVNAASHLSNIKLVYDSDTSAPYDCASESYGGSETQFGSTDTDGFSAADGTSAFTGSVAVSTTSTMCVYVVLDISSSANNTQTIEIEINNPNTDVTVSGGGVVKPVTTVTLSGTTTIASSTVDWYNANWGYRKKITLAANQVNGSSDLTNFPVLLSFTDTDLRDRALSSGLDIIFTSADGTTLLDFEIETYTSASGALVAWANVPLLDTDTDTEIYMYYGYSGASNLQDADNTWNSNYVLVQHLEEGSAGSTYTDSSGNSNHSTSVTIDGTGSNAAATGKIGTAVQFDGSNDKIVIADHATLDISQAITIEAWVALDSFGGSSEGSIVDKLYNTGYALYVDNVGVTNTVTFESQTNGVSQSANSNAVATGGSWYHVVVVYDRANVDFYVNGVDVGGGAETAAMSTNASTLSIGNQPSGTSYGFDGIIDEVRISNTNRSADWIITTYNNHNAPGTFATRGTEQTAPVTGPTNTQLLKHGLWFNTSGVRQKFTF